MATKPSFKTAIKSAFAAMFGVQNTKQHQQDFNSDTPFPYILAGVIVVIGFILAILTIVFAVIE